MATTSSEERSVRHSKDEIRALMMTAGTELLEEEGLGIGAVDLTFKRVFDRVLATSGVRLTNGSVIRRVWENQAEFQDDVLAAIARSGDSSGELDDTATALLAVFESIELATPEDRVRGLSEMCRVGGEAALRTLVDSGTWSLWVGVWVLAVTGPPSDRGAGIRAALVEGNEATTDLWGQMFDAATSYLGLRLRGEFTLRQLTLMVGALIEGGALRESADPEGASLLRPTGPDGAQQGWTLFGVGLEALALHYFEVDPDWTVLEIPGTVESVER